MKQHTQNNTEAIRTFCNHCGKEYDKQEIRRVYGANSMVMYGNYCSADCYTQVTMKQMETTPEAIQDNGNGHTPEWVKQDNIVYIKEGSVNIYAYPIIEKDYPVAYALVNSKIPTKQAEANAARIVECWNNYDQLKADNERLLAANKELIEGAANFIETMKSLKDQFLY